MNCRHADVCGGCSLLRQTYAQQIASKEESLRRLLGALVTPWPSRDALFLPVDGQRTAPSHFRQKVAFVFGTDPRTGALSIGHYARGSRRVVPVTECPVHSARGNRIAFALHRHLAKTGIPAAGPSLSGIVRHLIVRTTADDGEAVAMLVVTRNDKALRQPIRAFLDSPDRPDGFLLNIHDEPGPFMVGDRTMSLAGQRSVREVVGDISFLVTPTAFFQTNVRAAQALQAHVVDAVAGAKQVLDLYCGSGLFSLRLAKGGIRVTGVEENRQAVADAVANARLNRIPSSLAKFLASRTEDAVRTQGRTRWDAVILDPPRQGCSDSVLEAVFQEMQPPRAVYVSCNPQALAAELPGILQCGYEVSELRAVDMFPHTDHLEVVATLKRVS